MLPRFAVKSEEIFRIKDEGCHSERLRANPKSLSLFPFTSTLLKFKLLFSHSFLSVFSAETSSAKPPLFKSASPIRFSTAPYPQANSFTPVDHYDTRLSPTLETGTLLIHNKTAQIFLAIERLIFCRLTLNYCVIRQCCLVAGPWAIGAGGVTLS